MKKKLIEETLPARPEAGGKALTVQTAGDTLIINYWKDRTLAGRYCLNKTGEYAVHRPKEGTWETMKLARLLNGSKDAYYCYSIDDGLKGVSCTQADREAAEAFIREAECPVYQEGFAQIKYIEQDHNRERRQRTVQNRKDRIAGTMALVPPLPGGFTGWLFDTVMQGEEYAFYNKEQKKWSCTACGGTFDALPRPDGRKSSHNDRAVCPACGAPLQAKTRTARISRKGQCILMQDINDSMSVIRYIDVAAAWSFGGKKLGTSDAVRVVMYRQHKRGITNEILFNQYPRSEMGVFARERESFGRQNPSNRQARSGCLYPAGIKEALAGTCSEGSTRICRQMAAAGIEAEYGTLLAIEDEAFRRTIEYLFKGRFHRLLSDTLERTGYGGNYWGSLYTRGKTIEEVFRIPDRQMINRIRDSDGGDGAVRWLQWSCDAGIKISQETLRWLTGEWVAVADLLFITEQMTPEQAMNYVRRQQAEGYRNRTAGAVLEQWKDYLSMCRQLKKDTADGMVYRPRELKRRHDEAVEEIRRQQEAEAIRKSRSERAAQARKMRARYPGAEEILKEIRPKYQYENDEYIITVPARLSDIIADGQALHHCAGATDRYFDRILARETYICFLREKSRPKAPYYTIEVEPGGTIRQHRGYLDEEPDIGRVRPFLREWQREIRKRLSKKDRELAAVSKIKREQNIAELKRAGNTRVLNALMEDFMEMA